MTKPGVPWTLLAVAASAVFTCALVLPIARDFSFLWDDWLLLQGRTREVDEYWYPIRTLAFALERAAFGHRYVLFAAASCAVHVANVTLLARLLARETGDERAAAIATLAFGVCVVYREVLWWACLIGQLLAFQIVLVGLHVVARARDEGVGRATLAIVLACSFAAPLAMGFGFALGPTLALMALLELEGKNRWKIAGAAALGVLLHVPIVLSFGNPATSGAHPSPIEPRASVAFASKIVALGIVRSDLALPFESTSTPVVIFLFGAYVAAIALVARTVSPAARRKLVVAHALVLLVIAAIASKRGVGVRHLAEPDQSRYLYFVQMGWVTTLAIFLAGVKARRDLWAAIAVAVVIALAPAHVLLTFKDKTLPLRRQQPRVFELTVETARAAQGPVYDPTYGEGAGDLKASDVVSILAPDTSVIWTSVQTPATTAPWREATRLHPELTGHDR